MTTFLEAIDLDLNQVRMIVQAMVRVAHSDGAHQRELMLIREFYESCRAQVAGLADFADLTRAPFDAALAREVLASDAHKQTLLASCYLVAYADGAVSDPERQVIDELVRELAIDQTLANNTRELIKDQLLMQLARSENLEALQKIAAAL